MPKVPLSTITSGYGTVDALNANFDAIEAAFDNTLSRDGDTPNQMAANLDMNNYALLNVGSINGVTSNTLASLNNLNSLIDAVEVSATQAAQSASSAAATYDLFDDRYLGSKTSDPTVDNDNNALIDGALYFDTTNNVMKVYDLGNTTWRRTTPTSSDQTAINTVHANATNINTVATNIAAILDAPNQAAAASNSAATAASLVSTITNLSYLLNFGLITEAVGTSSDYGSL